jgi:hypothetical protein
MVNGAVVICAVRKGHYTVMDSSVAILQTRKKTASVLSPRALDPAATFAALVGWTQQLIVEKNAPGFILGLSGTDSILTFLVCATAFEMLGRPGRVVGVHYGPDFPPADKTPEEIEKILSFNPSYRWAPRVVLPWLRAQAPGAQVLVDTETDYRDDYRRWADLFRRSLNGALKTEPLPAGENFWVAGTRNATEQALATYSNISGAVSVQPILGLWKSEVLKLCQYLGVPTIAMEQSRTVDCDCGRFDVAAKHIEEVDWVVMAREGLVSEAWLAGALKPDLRAKLEAFVDEQLRYAGFKKEIPYAPPGGICVSET